MSMFALTRFTGTLSGHGNSLPVVFAAEVDSEGVLAVKLGRLPYSQSAEGLFQTPEPTELLDQITLEGVAEDGTRFHSDSFGILHFGHGWIEGQEIDIQGSCSLADITGIAAEPRERSSRLWLIRKFSSFRRAAHEVPLGRVVIGGVDTAADSQEPRGFLHLIHPSGLADDAWWAEAERFLVHLARLMSFACASNFLPVVERRFHGSENALRIVRRPRAAQPQLAPFSPSYLDAIFACACDSYFTRAGVVEQIEAAIRWLSMPTPAWESQLVNTMTAIENLLEGPMASEARLFETKKAFRERERAVREMLGNGNAPPGMLDKIPELNRPSLRHQLEVVLAERSIVTDDFPEGWLAALIATRNHIIHTGVLPKSIDTSSGIPRHVIWARELAVRMILHLLGFEGGYQSWLHRDQTLHFPTCRPMADIVSEQPE